MQYYLLTVKRIYSYNEATMHMSALRGTSIACPGKIATQSSKLMLKESFSADGSCVWTEWSPIRL